MYERHFAFTARPFAPAPEPRNAFLWPAYQEALANIELGVRERSGLLLLTGEGGAGKTTLVRHVLSSLGPDVRIAAILDPKRSAGEVLHSILQDLDVPFQGGTVKGAAEDLQAALIRARSDNAKIVILVDGAEELKPFVLELLLRLANLDVEEGPLMTLILTGRPGLHELLRNPSLHPLAQRAAAQNRLAPLSLDQTRAYIRHRLALVGGTGSEIDESGIRRVHQLSKGLPGRVNKLCAEALTLAFDRGQKRVDEALISGPAFARRGTIEGARRDAGFAVMTHRRRLRRGALVPLFLGAITGVLIIFVFGRRVSDRPERPAHEIASPLATATATASATATVSTTVEAVKRARPGQGESSETAAQPPTGGRRARIATAARPPAGVRKAPIGLGRQKATAATPAGKGTLGSAQNPPASTGADAGVAAAAPRPAAKTHAEATAGATDPEFAKLVKEWTTRPEFSSPLVDFLPLKKGIPTPKDILGRYVGMPDRLTSTGEAYRYYRALEKASPRVKILVIGKTDEGREQLIVNIADEQTIKDLELYRGYLGQIADPRRFTEAHMKDVIAKAKPIYYVSGGQHSSETGPPEMLMELAYRLVADDSPMYEGIRDNIIVAINPVVEPDGRDRVVDWYHQHKVGETDERNVSASVPYWGKYLFDDNDRDINYSQVTMKNVLDWYLKWHPPIMHDLRESVPFLYTFSGQAPQNPTLDPILSAELPWFANYERSQMAKYGMPGVWDFGFVDLWSPGDLAFMSSNHNGIIRIYETFGNGGATTMKRKVAGNGFGPDQTSGERFRPWPPYKEVVWSMRNNTNYMQTGVLSALELTSKFPKVILENFYKKTFNSIESGKKDAPFGYVIPGGQKDQTRVAMLINLLRIQGIEVGKATADLTVKEGTFPAGSYVIKRDQPYGRLAKILLEKQSFPEETLRTYDDTGWTMGLMNQTEVKEIADLAILQAAVEPVDMIKLQGVQTGASRFVVVLNHGANNMATLRFKLKGIKALTNEKAVTGGSTPIPAGSLWLDTKGHDASTVRAAVESLGLTAVTMDSGPQGPTHEVDVPRLAVFSTWGNTQEVGWVRHAFDYHGIPFTLIYKDQVKAGKLRKDYDVILIPNQGRSAKGLVFDVPNRGKRLPYKKDPKFPTMGGYGESDDITGGMGLPGAVELDAFVNEGGSLVTLAAASYFPPDFGLARQIDARSPSPAFYAPGPIIEAEIQAPDSPIFYGYANKTIPVRYGNGPLLTVPELLKERVLMKYPGQAKSVLSGLFRGADEIRDRPAIVNVPVGRGQIVLFAGNPCYRWQNHGEFAMLFNTILHWNDLLNFKAPIPAERPAATEH